MSRKLAVCVALILLQSMAGWAQLPNPAPPPARLSVTDAEALALKNNPQVRVATLTALASKQVVRETRSAYWPQAVADLTAVDARSPASRITAGGLNNPIIYERAAGGTEVSQLITDFGRTSNLVASSNLRSKQEEQNAIATSDQIKLAVDQAFYGALQTAALLRVAQETVKERQTVADQIQALYNNKLKSELDLSFAKVNLAQAQLLLLDAQNNNNAASAILSEVLGYSTVQTFQMVEDTSPFASPPTNVDQLIVDAMQKRPELTALSYGYRAAEKFRVAERDLMLPTVSALGAVGGTPVRNDVLTSWYGAVGVNVQIPIFNGFLYSARAQQAKIQAQAEQERLRQLQDIIARDVRTSWLNATTSYTRLAVAQQLLQQSNLALDLAQTRYNLGLGSIVELSQAQLQQTQAEISNTQAGYEYRLALSVLRFQTANY